jgi:hypothetical protein
MQPSLKRAHVESAVSCTSPGVRMTAALAGPMRASLLIAPRVRLVQPIMCAIHNASFPAISMVVSRVLP